VIQSVTNLSLPVRSFNFDISDQRNIFRQCLLNVWTVWHSIEIWTTCHRHCHWSTVCMTQSIH